MFFIDDITLGRLNPNRTRKEQANNGLRLGIGAGAFLVGAGLLVAGLTRVVSSVPPYPLVWSNWGAWVEICIALVLLFFTAQVWLLLVGAFALRGFIYGVLVLISGNELLSPHRPVPRGETSAIAFFSLTTLLLLFRFHDTRPSILDRVALTFYLLATAFALLGHKATSSLIDPWLVAGLIALAISWCVYRWKTPKPRGKTTTPRTPEAQFPC